MENEKPASYTEEYALRSVDCGADGSMRLDAVYEVLQEAAGYHADQLGAGFMELLPTGRTWILSRMRVDILKSPRYRDVISIKTWPRGIQGILALRDFRITAGNGTPLALATSSWLLVEVAGRRPLRVADFLADKFVLTDEKALGADAAKVDPFEAVPSALPGLSFRVRPSDLDMNGHTTNTAYLKMLADGLAEAFPAAAAKSVEVNFTAEAFLGDPIVLSFAGADAGALPGRAKLASPDGTKDYVRFALR
jgi:acyl-ACP thioesterase